MQSSACVRQDCPNERWLRLLLGPTVCNLYAGAMRNLVGHPGTAIISSPPTTPHRCFLGEFTTLLTGQTFSTSSPAGLASVT